MAVTERATCPTCGCGLHTPARTHAVTCVECEVVKFPMLASVPERYTCEFCRVELERLGREEWDRRRERQREHGARMAERRKDRKRGERGEEE